ncbi:hypothetical protein TFLX_02522 [Thermoflexales bacterium]|nr:hypothetical protein TFLX_02522 [Thermoflexales bacterium]
MPVKRIQHLFVVRLWADTAAVPTSEDWHGLVQHVPTGQKLYFTSLADLNDFMEARLEVGSSPQERSDGAVEAAVSVTAPE